MHVLFCLVCRGICTFYLEKLNPNSFSLLFLLLYAKRIMLVSCLPIQLYKNNNNIVRFVFFPFVSQAQIEYSNKIALGKMSLK